MSKEARRSAASGSASIGMSPKTKGFLQKICYKIPASVDMTQYGFICDSKVTPVNLLLKPLREKLERICGPSEPEKKKKIRKSGAGTKTPRKTERGGRPNNNQNVKAYMSTMPKTPAVAKRPAPKVVPPSPAPSETTMRKSRVTFREPCSTLMQIDYKFRKW